ncbi:hypothetical protein QFZ28_000882 [Neobacillus niacini]|nr:hypothetical protein [Neobacillus niacini]
MSRKCGAVNRDQMPDVYDIELTKREGSGNDNH